MKHASVPLIKVICTLIVGLCLNHPQIHGQNLICFEEKYESTGANTRNTVGTGIQLDTQDEKLRFVSSSDGGIEERLYKALPFTLTNTWKADIEFTPTEVGITNQTGHIIMALTASGQFNPYNVGGSSTLSDQDAIMAEYITPNTSTTLVIRGRGKDGDVPGVPSVGIEAPLNETHYIRLERLNRSEAMISVYTDPARTQHRPNSPQCFSIASGIEGLNTLQHSNIPQGHQFRQLTASLDNFNICDFSPDIDASSDNCLDMYTGWTIINPELTNVSSPLPDPNDPSSGCGSISIDNTTGVLSFNNVEDAGDQRAYKQLASSLSDSWKAEMKFRPTGRGTAGVGHAILALTSGPQTGPPNPLNVISDPNANPPVFGFSDLDAITVEYISPLNGSNSTFRFQVRVRNVGSTDEVTGNTGPQIIGMLHTDHYVRLERLTETEGRLSVYSNPGFTTHLTNSPLCFSINPFVDNLSYVQHATIPQGSVKRRLTADISDLCITNTNDHQPSILVGPPNPSCYRIVGVNCIPGATGYTWTLDPAPAGVTITPFQNANTAKVFFGQNNYSGDITVTVNFPDCYSGVCRVVSATRSISWDADDCIYLPRNGRVFMKAYPNPSRGNLIWEVSNLEAEDKEIHVTILDLSGKKVWEKQYERETENQLFKHKVDISHLAKGLYLLQISGKDFELTEKISLY